MKFILVTTFIFSMLIVAPLVQAQDEHKLLRRVVVFPFQAGKEFTSIADETWWTIRESLTLDKRFLVASKSFLKRKDVFQTRGNLSPADAIILGELLDAHLIITGKFEGRALSLMAYESQFGRNVWRHEIRLHPSVPIAEQLPKTGERLVKDFISSIPYHGFVIKDSLIGQVVYQENESTLIQAEIGANSKIVAGDLVQIVRVYNNNQRPLFMGGSTIEVFAEGQVLAVKPGLAIINLLRVTNTKDLAENSLVRFPKEVKRLKELYAIKDSLSRRIAPEYFSPEISPVSQEVRETKPLVAALTFIVNVATVLLLAF